MKRLKFSSAIVLCLVVLQFAACSDRIIVPDDANPNRGNVAYTTIDYSLQGFQVVNAISVDTTGKAKRTLLSNAAIFASASGRILTSVLDQAGKLDRIVVASDDGSNQQQVYIDTSLSLEWPQDISTDGKHIALSFKDTSGTGLLFLMDLDGSNPRLITNKLAHESRARFSNKGDKLAFYTSDKTGNAVSIYDVVRSTMITVARPEGLLPDGYARISWSHDDAKIAYIARTSTGNEVHVVNADGWQEATAAKGISAAWSPTADALAYDDETGGLHFLTDSGYVYNQPSPFEGLRVWDWTLDGKYVVCESWTGDYDHSTVSVKLVNASTGEAKVVATPGIMPMVLR